MIITLSWWMIPLLLMLFSVAVSNRHKDVGGYINFDFTGMFVFFICASLSIGIIAGHFLTN